MSFAAHAVSLAWCDDLCMCADVLTTWGVVLELDGMIDEETPESASRWFAQGRQAFFERCPRLTEYLGSQNADLRVTTERIDPIASASRAGGLRVGVSVIEVRPSSFDMAVRLRPAGEGAGEPANGRCTVVIERRATGERIVIPREVRDEFSAIQLAAHELC